jgi:ATP-dependent Lhr-like helicase
VHQGLAALAAYRLSRVQAITFTLTANDYGFELLAPERDAFADVDVMALLSTDNLLDDIVAGLNESEMAQRQFREIARVAGLVFQGFPGRPQKARHLQASSSMLYEVFRKYDAGNLLLVQAHREVLSRQLEQSRLQRTLDRADRAARRGQGHAPPVAAVLPPAGRAVAGQHPHERVAGRAGAQDDGLGRERSVTRSAGC